LDIFSVLEKFKEFSIKFNMNVDVENDKIISGLIFTIGRPIFMENKITIAKSLSNCDLGYWIKKYK
jgi:hypothetical protein